MKTNTQKIIENIVAAFNVDEGHTIFYTQHNIGTVTGDMQEQNKLVNRIMDLLYSNFYCKTSQAVKSTIDDDAFYKLLQNEGNSQQVLDKGWKLIEQEANGDVYIQKQNRLIHARAGSYLIEQASPAGRFAYVTASVMPPNNTPGEYFFYVTSETPFSGNMPVARFYFNINPVGAPVLIKLIRAHFNLFGVPFTFKCCAKPSYYNRTDTAVLYIDYSFFSISIQLLEKVVAGVKKFLNKDVPLFTYKIENGFSFAEDPGGNLSFGQNRCRIVANGLIECFVSKFKKEKWVELIVKKFIADGYNVDKLYLNPASSIQYNFSLGGFINE